MDRIHARVFELVRTESKAGAVVKLEEWHAKRGEILARHYRDIDRLFSEVERLQKKVIDIQQIHKLELAMWDNSQPRTWRKAVFGV